MTPQSPGRKVPCAIQVRRYGDSGGTLVLLHGGPGAAGYMAPVARYLCSGFRVLEPLQRHREDAALTVALHVQDLHDVVSRHCGGERPFLLGHSWGAMLALAYAAEHPAAAKALVLVGCGTFDSVSRERVQAAVDERMAGVVAERLRRAGRSIRDPDVRLCVTGRILEPLYSFQLEPHEDATVEYDGRGHVDTWRDMLRLQRAGVYPSAFSRIHVPILMMHGVEDPHPGALIRNSLLPHLPQLEYVALPRCGHYPWLERDARELFLATLIDWLHLQGC